MKENIKKYGYFAILGCILLLGLILRLKGVIANPSFWNDECSLAWNAVHQTYSDFFSLLSFGQIAPPFFMVLSKFFTQIFGASDFTLRLVPFLFGCLSMILFLAISTKIFKKKITIIMSTLVFATNPALINYSSEFKQYSCDVFFTLLCFYVFIDVVTNKISIKKTILYSITLAVSIWFSFTSIFVIGAGFIVILGKRLKNEGLKNFRLKSFSFLFLPLIISGLLCYKFYISNNYTTNIDTLNEYWVNSFIAKDFSNFFSLTIKNIKYFLYPSTFIFPAIIAIIMGIFSLFKRKFSLAAILILTICLECFASWLGFYPFEKRVILFLNPIVLLLITTIFESVNIKHKLKSSLIFLLFFIIFIQPFFYSYSFLKTPKPTRGYYSREMMAKMLDAIKPNDIIVVNKYSRNDFAYYSAFYKIKNKVIHEGQTGDRAAFLNSLQQNKYYWFYMPFGPSPTFDKWFTADNRKILLEIKGNGPPCKLVYVYSK